MPDQGALHEPFHKAARQNEANRLGMIVFLASEAMLFGGLFASALALRLTHPVDYLAAAAHLKLWFGATNTAVLLTSSMIVALSVEAARCGRGRAAGRLLAVAMLLGFLFLGR